MPTSQQPPSQPPAEQPLHQIWRDRKADFLQDPQEVYQLARKANRAGEFLLALEMIESVLEAAQGDARIQLLQQKALALARSAATEQALRTLEQIGETGSENAETSGLLGRIYKDLAEGTSDGEERKKFLAKSLFVYRAGFEQTQPRSAYCGINAAALAALSGDLELAQTLARQTLEAPSQGDDYYDLATHAEAMLILKRTDEAADLYRRACAAGKNKWGDLVSTRNQCRKLARALYEGRASMFDACFPTGTVAIFAGHMIDGPNRAEPRFPPGQEQSVRERICAWLRNESIRQSFSSAASGSDLLFLEAAQELGVQTHIVLPFAVERFIETSVRPSGEAWVERFRNALERAERIQKELKSAVPPVTIINDDVADDASSAYDFTNRMIAAKAALVSKALGWPTRALCVWNRLPGDGGGGTADAVLVWCRAKIPVQAIHPALPERDGPVREDKGMPIVSFERTRSAVPTGLRGIVCAMMHVYFEGYFGLRENQYPLFQEAVLRGLANALLSPSPTPASRYGLGPDYVFVFETLKAAGLFAIAALETIDQALKTTVGLTMDMPRICLHAGSVQLMVNPILNQYTHEGTSLTRAGRIARNLEPGVAYCTEPFAALSALEAIQEFRCEPAGVFKYAGGAQDRLFSVRYRPKTPAKK